MTPTDGNAPAPLIAPQRPFRCPWDGRSPTWRVLEAEHGRLALLVAWRNTTVAAANEARRIVPHRRREAAA